MDVPSAVSGLLLATFLGTATGLLTGLAPGLHVNNVAALVVATKAGWFAAFGVLAPAWAIEPGGVALLAACYLLAAASSHAVVDFVPSVFFGAPTEETALSLLPGHRLLLRGQGPKAVALAARGSVLGAFLAVVLLVPLRTLLSDPVGLADAFRPWAPVFLAGLLAALLVTEARSRHRARRVAGSALVQLLAGALGLVALRGPAIVDPNTALFPLFAGLFGLPNLILSLRTRPGAIPPQRNERLGPFGRADLVHATRGAVAGAAVSWLPGLSGGAAATLASATSRRTISPPAFMVVLGAVSTSTTILSVAVLFMIGKTRCGTAVAVRDFLGWPAPWADPLQVPLVLGALVVASILAVTCAAPISAALARALGPRWSDLDPRRLSAATLGGITLLLAIASGPWGLALAAFSALVGAVPIRIGVRRVHLMAALLVPVLVGYLAP